MDQLNQLNGIILITESIIEDQKLIKDIAENLHHEIKYLVHKHVELKDILSHTQEKLLTTTHIPIDIIIIPAKEVNVKKNEQQN